MEHYYSMASRRSSILAVLLATLCVFGGSLANPTSNVEINEAVDNTNEVSPEDAPTSTPSVNILYVERSPVPGNDDESKFTIRFTKQAHSSDVFVRVYDQFLLPRVPDNLVEEGNGVWLTEFTVNRRVSRGAAPWIYIGSDDDYMIGLLLNNFRSLQESQLQNTLNVPELRTQPAMEAVYQPGQDVQVTISSPRVLRHPNEQQNPTFYNYFTGVDLHTNLYHYDFERDLFNESAMESLPDRFQQRVTVLTSEHPVSGFMEFTLFQQHTGGNVVSEIMASKYVWIRPSNQTSYLPPGYLAVVPSPQNARRRNGIDRFTCRSVSTCKPTCHAVGDFIFDLEAVQVLPDGSLRHMTSLYPPQLRNTYRVIYWHLNNEDGSLQEGQTIRFDCVAYDTVTGRTATRPIGVYIARGALQN